MAVVLFVMFLCLFIGWKTPETVVSRPLDPNRRAEARNFLVRRVIYVSHPTAMFRFPCNGSLPRRMPTRPSCHSSADGAREKCTRLQPCILHSSNNAHIALRLLVFVISVLILLCESESTQLFTYCTMVYTVSCSKFFLSDRTYSIWRPSRSSTLANTRCMYRFLSAK